MRCLSFASSVLLVGLLSGCQLYFLDDDDPPPPCVGAPDIAAAFELRNPENGECLPFGSGGGGCDGSCGPCPQTTDVARAPLPNWGQCHTQCDQLDESSCLTASGCQAAYLESPHAPAGSIFFHACWATAQHDGTEPACDGLDSNGCAQRDDCGMVYDANLGPNDGLESIDFDRCVPENEPRDLCASDNECGGDQRCTAGQEECLPAPGCDGGMACPAVCYGHCVGETAPACATLTTEMGCKTRPDCDAVYDGQDCTCDASGCVCKVLTYEQCEAK